MPTFSHAPSEQPQAGFWLYGPEVFRTHCRRDTRPSATPVGAICNRDGKDNRPRRGQIATPSRSHSKPRPTTNGVRIPDRQTAAARHLAGGRTLLST
jgi:hypothetical protein